ncbi:sodium/calcium exchanger protein [Talaromyces stipitatus ATCC 10500]|uniref:Sodium/calcium exchanger protein n=1 Tax=Talaromyces stipitatus (strain ATCC 10500 / CBS 375.48 / QM 6759 / NRRL 1006) TaxID=441959 RepID=B8LZG6_TALSN|nr:sodium/calcium exchanger protein [Talaromyces stipitatus ATCC 10500]EED21719.1 sodium/calcium exchanger protein [Talaromyces stipitatus ATCC 10500]
MLKQHKIFTLPQLRPRMHQRYHPRPFFLSIAVLSTLALGSWIARYFESQLLTGDNGFQKRMAYSELQINSSRLGPFEQEIECRFVRHADDQCAFVKSNCPDENGIFPYLQLYYCSLRHVQPIAFAIIIAWLSLLFSTIGIAASDFLCINLSAIASILRMSESLTGVTFLAFGNGSPDVFSTFAAMGSNSGSLAIGELIGAACFITAVVAGSMALARPFRVARRSFVRDVAFFIFAAILTVIVLADGELHVWECVSMIGLYVFYVILVVSWHWYLTRKRRKYDREIAARAHFHIPQSQELDLEEHSSDEEPISGDTSNLLQGQRSPDLEALERSAWKDDDEEDDETRNRYLAEIRENMRVTRPPSFARRPTTTSIRPSLVGALEFQSVLSSLKKAKSIHDDTIDLGHYVDTDSVSPSPRILPRSSQGRSPFQRREGHSDRRRSASLNDTPTLRIDTTVNDAKEHSGTLIPVIGGSSNNASLQHGTQVQHLQHQPSTPSTLSVPRSPASPLADRLTVPHGPFHSPNYQISPRSHQLPSPGGVSPLGHILPQSINFEQSDESDNETIRFPPFVDSPASLSPKPSVLNLPAASYSPSREYQSAFGQEERMPRWWYYPSLIPGTMFFTLFPTLCDWRSKSFWAKILSVVAAPSVFSLTITIPVIDPSRAEATNDKTDNRRSSSALPNAPDGDPRQPTPIIRLPDESPTLQPQDHQLLGTGLRDSTEHTSSVVQSQDSNTLPNRARIDSELAAGPPELGDGSSSTTARTWHRVLTTIHVFTSPLFTIVAFWTLLDDEHDLRNLIIPIPVSLGVSLVCAVLLNMFLKGHDNLSQAPDQLRPVLSFIGFIVGICWIAIIADEVVSLLKTIGVILDISDSLLGLTIFAVGNSLSDLVADITVARLGYPVMALSACFGGPMLNILLGIGIGGLYMTLHSNADTTTLSTITQEASRHAPYRITISRNLIISGVTLLLTLVGLLILVPLNHWKMDRKIGCGLIVLWSLSTLGNVILEIVT